MNQFVSKTIKIVTGRLARNIYFWVLFASTRFDFKYTNWQLLITMALFALLATAVYINNLILVPRLLARKKRLAWIISYTGLVFIISFIYLYTIKWMLHTYPGSSTGSVSPIMSSQETGTLTIASILNELSTFFNVIFIFGLMFTLCWLAMDYARQQKMLEEATIKQTETELNFLKSQINPHFLFNTLNNLYALTVKKSDDAPDIVSKLSTILRYLLYESNVSTISFEKEKEMMQAYIDLELLRITNKENMQFAITTDKPCSIPPLLWIPVLENVFKHGTRFISSQYFIEYRFAIENNMLTICSKNSYKAEPAAKEEQKGIGLANLRKRLLLLYPGRHEIVTKQEDNYYITEVKIAL